MTMIANKQLYEYLQIFNTSDVDSKEYLYLINMLRISYQHVQKNLFFLGRSFYIAAYCNMI